MKNLLKRYQFFLILLLVLAGIAVFDTGLGVKATQLSWDNLLDLLAVVPPIFILLGLLDVWVPREVMIRLTGENSGFIGVALSFLLGSFAAGPLYAAFPVAGIMLKKAASCPISWSSSAPGQRPKSLCCCLRLQPWAGRSCLAA